MKLLALFVGTLLYVTTNRTPKGKGTRHVIV